ncbi:MAG: acyltransferase [Burkholderiales bacterium]|nr:acyltransferase [Bacteroidia bacterium]
MVLNSNQRFIELDGLRGLAAFSVFLSHFIGFYFESNNIKTLQSSPLRIFWNGDAAVNLFFVLSGFVLAISFFRTNITFLQYSIKRLFRIYPAYYFSIGFSLILMKFFIPNNLTELSFWAQSFWKNKIKFSEIVDHLILIKHFNTHLINPVIWSLGIEIKMSLLIPFIALLYKKERAILFSLSILVVSWGLSLTIPFLFYLPQFVLGLLFAVHYGEINQHINRFNKLKFFIFSLLFVFLYGNRFLLPEIAEYSEWLTTVLAGFGSIGLIIISIKVKKIKTILSSKLGKFLGETSYSFYLLHLPLLLITFSFTFLVFHSAIYCGILALIITYALSYFIYKTVEIKMISIGNTISKKRLMTKRIFKFL